jgi:hypothetical protein
MSSAVYTKPIQVSAAAVITFFAVDPAGNAEAAMTGTWSIHSSDLSAALKINGGSTTTNNPSVILTLSADDPEGIATMQFSNDGINYTDEEPYNTAKAWSLVPGDGLRTVYVRFRDKALPSGVLYDPVTASITVSTVPPVTTSSPVPGTYAGNAVSVTLASDEQAVIHYTTDGSTPTTASTIYSKPIKVTKATVISYFAVDLFGNAEAVMSGTWAIHTSDMTASVKINGGAKTTDNPVVTLTLSASDPLGVDTMQFSNDGASYTAEEPYATSRTWTLPDGDGLKTVYVRFREIGRAHV